MKKFARLFVYILLLCHAASAQVNKTYTVAFKDSLVADQASYFLYNSIRVKNLTNDSITIQINLTCPKGWHLLSGTESTITILASQEYILPITLVKRANTPSDWRIISIYAHCKDLPADSFGLNVRAEPLSSFSVTQPQATFSAAEPREFATKFELKNNGNVDGEYHIVLGNEYLNLNYQAVIELAPGKDTTCIIRHTIPKHLWYGLKNETIRFVVADSMFVKKIAKRERKFRADNNNTNNNPFCTTYDIIRQDSVFQMYSSKYTGIKMKMETGYIMFDNMASYYAAVRVDMPINGNSDLSIGYRTRQFGLYNVMDRDILDINYTSNHFLIHAGKITNSKYFSTYGNGASVDYRWGNGFANSITVFAVKHTPGFYTTNDNAGMTLKYKFRKITLCHDLLFNTDSASRLNSYILNNDVNLIATRKMGVSFNAGVGFQQDLVLNSGEPKGSWGTFYGYHVNYKSGNWIFNSQVRLYSNDFPGIDAGMRTQSHSLRYRKHKLTTELYYEYDQQKNNFFRDTLYNMDVLSFNIAKYGVRFTVPLSDASNVTVGGGILSQQGQATYAFAPKYDFIEFQYSNQSSNHFGTSLFSTTGYANINGHAAYITSITGAISYRFFGINGGYTSIPEFGTNQTGDRAITMYHQTIYGGPYATFAYKGFSAGVQYSLSKTLYDNQISPFVGLNISYNNERNGMQFSINSSTPLKQPDGSSADPTKYGYLNVSFKKTLNVPFIFKRRYYDVKARMYEDVNGDGKLDEGDEVLKDMPFTINDVHFVTDHNGGVIYKNVDTGNYSIDFTNTAVKGLVPTDGKTQVLNVTKNTTIDVPFNRSTSVTGHINIIQDSLTEVSFRANNIKITAQDKAGHTYTTIANTKGDFFINLPAASYTISLNPSAFNEYFKPVKMSYDLDLTKDGNNEVNFTIKQRKREIHMLKVDEVVAVKQSALLKLGTKNTSKTTIAKPAADTEPKAAHSHKGKYTHKILKHEKANYVRGNFGNTKYSDFYNPR